jgi:hypothetical protein
VRNAPLEERLAIGEIDPADSIADIRNFLAAHRVGAVMVSDVGWQVVLDMRAATGHWGIRLPRLRLFLLGNRFTDPALAHQPIRRIGSNRLVHQNARKAARRARRAARHVQPVRHAQLAHRARTRHHR